MTYPVNSDGPRKPINSLAEQVRGKSKIVEPSILPLTEKPSQTGTPSEGDRIPQDTVSLCWICGLWSNCRYHICKDCKSKRENLPPVTIIGKDGGLYREGEKVGQLKDNVRPYREKILDHFANEMSAQDLRDWAEEFRLRAKEK